MASPDDVSARAGAVGGTTKEDAVEVAGVVVESLPSAMFRVELDSRHQVLAHMADDIGKNFIRLLIGDRVLVRLSPYDVTRGRIVRRVS